MMGFSKGDKVVLKSGGPLMTVMGDVERGETVELLWMRTAWGAGAVICQWWDEKRKEYQTHPFEAEWLVAAPEPEPG